MEKKFHDILKELMDEFVHLVYKITREFPREELYGTSSQLRRAALSVILNYIEGYARKRRLVKINFFETSFGSLKESKYLLEFAQKEEWINIENFQKAMQLSERISAMLWRTIKNLESESDKT